MFHFGFFCYKLWGHHGTPRRQPRPARAAPCKHINKYKNTEKIWLSVAVGFPSAKIPENFATTAVTDGKMSQSGEEESLDKEMEEESKETVGTKEEVTLDDEMEQKERADPPAATAGSKESRKRPKSEEDNDATAAERDEKPTAAATGGTDSSAASSEDGRRLTRKKPKVDYSEAAQAAAAAEVKTRTRRS